jgi:hypothetical protein
MKLGGNSTNKIVAMLGLAAVVFVGVTWVLPKFEKKPNIALGFDYHNLLPPEAAGTTVATGKAAYDQSLSGLRDFNLSGLAMEEVANYATSSGVALSGI